MHRSNPAALGPLHQLPSDAQDLTTWRILFLVTSVNSFTQRLWAYFEHLGFEHISCQVVVADRPGETAGHDDAIKAVEAFKPTIVICPFLMAKVPEEIFENVSFLLR